MIFYHRQRKVWELFVSSLQQPIFGLERKTKDPRSKNNKIIFAGMYVFSSHVKRKKTYCVVKIQTAFALRMQSNTCVQ